MARYAAYPVFIGLRERYIGAIATLQSRDGSFWEHEKVESFRRRRARQVSEAPFHPGLPPLWPSLLCSGNPL